MEQLYKDYLIAGSAIPGPPNTGWYWYAHGSVLKSRPDGSAVEVARIQDDGFAFEMKALADWYGMELCASSRLGCVAMEYFTSRHHFHVH